MALWGQGKWPETRELGLKVRMRAVDFLSFKVASVGAHWLIVRSSDLEEHKMQLDPLNEVHTEVIT